MRVIFRLHINQQINGKNHNFTAEKVAELEVLPIGNTAVEFIINGKGDRKTFIVNRVTFKEDCGIDCMVKFSYIAELNKLMIGEKIEKDMLAGGWTVVKPM